MPENVFSITEDTQATLLLCSTLGSADMGVRPLTLPQYNALVQALVSLGKRPSDLLQDAGLVETICSMPVENARLKEPVSASRLKALLDRGFALSMAVNRWAQYGVRPVGRADGLYPARMKQYLKGKAPAVLYYAGRDLLWLGGGMAFVGSRNISEEATDAIRRIVRECVVVGMTIVSGGARGADQTSMHAAFEEGGNVIAALPGDLLKTCLLRENREAIAAGRVLLFSAVEPEERFSTINAMERNKYIYAMSDCAFVAQSDTKGGTWTGAMEELKRQRHHPVYVYMGRARVDGCIQLVAKGGIAWTPEDSLQTMLEKGQTAANERETASQLSLFDYMATHHDFDTGPDKSVLQVSESKEMYCPEEKSLYSAVLPLLLAAAGSQGQTEKNLRRKVDPDGCFSPKGWKFLLEKACVDGVMTRTERPKKRGKPDIVFVRCQAGNRGPQSDCP